MFPCIQGRKCLTLAYIPGEFSAAQSMPLLTTPTTKADLLPVPSGLGSHLQSGPPLSPTQASFPPTYVSSLGSISYLLWKSLCAERRNFSDVHFIVQ